MPMANKFNNPPKKIDPEKIIVDEIRSRIDSYFCIVLRNIRDSIPKIIGHFLVKAIQENLQYCLYNELNKSENIMSSIGEPPHITAERETLSKVLEVLQRAKRVLTKDPDLAPQFSDPKPPTTSTKISSSASEKSSTIAPHTRVEETKSKDDSLGPMTTSSTVTNPNIGGSQNVSRPTTQPVSNPTKEVFGDSLKPPFQSTNPSTNNSTLNTSTVSQNSSTSENKTSLFGGNTQPSQSTSQSGSSNPFGNPQQTQPKTNPPKKTGLFG